MPLDEYTFQLDTGPILNAESVFPFVDIARVVGLDSSPYRETIRDHEGQDGGYIDAEFERGREVVLEGTVYSDVNNIETFLDDLKENFGPRTAPIPLVFKSPGVEERVLFVKPRGCRYNWESARRVGMTPIQFLMYAEDPRVYDNALNNIVVPFGGLATTGFGFGTDSAWDPFNDFTLNPTWNIADSGESWSNAGGVDADYTISAGVGRVRVDAVNSSRRTILAVNLIDSDILAYVSAPVMSTGDDFQESVMSRYTGSEAYYYAELQFQPDGTMDMRLILRNAGATTLATATNIGAWAAGDIWAIRMETIGTSIRAKGWPVTSSEPEAWHVSATDATWAGPGDVGTRSLLGASNTNTLPVVFTWYNFTVTSGGFEFDLDFGDVVPPAGGTIVNEGNRPTPAILTIEGPVVDPRISNTTANKTLEFTITLGVGETLEIDLANRTVTLNGTVNRRDALTGPNWFLFDPGTSFVTFGGSSGSGTLTIDYRNAWR